MVALVVPDTRYPAAPTPILRVIVAHGLAIVNVALQLLTASRAIAFLWHTGSDVGRIDLHNREQPIMKTNEGILDDLVTLVTLMVVASAGLWGPLGSASAHGQKRPPPQPAPTQVELGPYVQYTTPSQAIVFWWTAAETASILDYGLAGPGAKHSPSIQLQGAHQGKLENRLEDAKPKKVHAITIDGLRPNQVYAYRITTRSGDVERNGDVYELDTALNYTVRPLPTDLTISGNPDHTTQMRLVAEEILQRAGVTKGYCLVWGLADGVLAYELAAQSELVVIGLDDDAGRVAQVRENLYRAGVYGTRITVLRVESLSSPPYPTNFANLLVSERILVKGQCPGSAAQMYRLLRPRGGAAVLSATANPSVVETWLRTGSVGYVKQETPAGVFCIVSKPVPAGSGSWTHQYGDAGNTANSHDDLSGATRTDQMRLQWLGRPGADFGMDRNPRMPAPLAANGRLFHQGMNRMVAIDAYNGTILWSLEIPALQRVNLPRDAGNWCADDATLYVAIREYCWLVGGSDGVLQRVVGLPEGFSPEQYDWGYIARNDNLLFGSAVKKDTSYTEFWGDAAWYDKTSGAGTEKVCSDALFCYDLPSSRLLWTWRSGLVINTTIAVGKQGVFFVESRNPTSKASSTRRLNDAALWSDQYLVRLNAQTGEPIWETPIDTADGIVVFYLACTDDDIVIVSSANGAYHLYRYDPDDGTSRWHAEHKWPSDNHGGHLQHPVVLSDRVFLEPCGYDLGSGMLLTSTMSAREGCATYCGTNHALVHRGLSRCVTMWDYLTGSRTSWRDLRPSCWLSTIVGEGMVLSPEGGGGCSCGNWLETSLAFSPLQWDVVVNRRPPPKSGDAAEDGGE